jgi:hypothetical protein
MQEHRSPATQVKSLPCLDKDPHKQTESLHIPVAIQIELHTQRSLPWRSHLTDRTNPGFSYKIIGGAEAYSGDLPG